MYRAKILALGLLVVPFVAFACGDDPESPPATEVPDASTPDVEVTETGSGDAGSTDEPWKAGSRLVPRFLTTTDGMKAFVGMLDTKLDTFCVPTKEFDTVFRCSPRYSEYFTKTSFADALCTRPVVAAIDPPQNGCEAKRFAAVTKSNTNPGPCGGTGFLDLYQVVAMKIDLPKVYEKTAQGCAESVNPAGSYTELGAIPPSELVLMNEVKEPASPAIQRIAYAGEDGSRYPQYSLFDTARNAVCVPASESDAKTRCIPVNGAMTQGYTDNGCSQMAVVKDECPKPPDPNESFVIRYESNACTTKATVYDVGPKRATRDIYSGSPGACDGPTQHTSDVFDLGPVVGQSKFPELDYVEKGGTRMLVRTYTSQGKLATFLQESFFDKTLSTICNLVVLQDGKLHCVPVFRGGGVFYSDASCETKIVVEYENDCAPPKYVREPVDAPPGICRTQVPGIYEVGAKLPGTTAYQKTAQGCDPVTGVKAVYTLGPLLPPSTFAEGTYVPK